MKRLPKLYVRYKVGLVISAIFLIVTILAIIFTLTSNDGASTAEKITGTSMSVAILILPVFGCFLGMAIARSAGTGEFTTRSNEVITIDNGMMTYRFTLISKKGIAAVEGNMTYSVPLNTIYTAILNKKYSIIDLVADQHITKSDFDDSSIIETKDRQMTGLRIPLYFGDNETLAQTLRDAAQKK